jgi:hypothetical protein
MADIKWAELCELAMVDKCDRLCIIGITTRLPVPSIPLVVRQLMVAARISDVQRGEPLGVGVSMVTPSGQWLAPDQGDGFDVRIDAEYILITLRDIPLYEEGLYRFEVSLNNGEPAKPEVLVGLVSKRTYVEIEAGDTSASALERAWRQRRDVN